MSSSDRIPQPIGIIGTGAVGTALAQALRARHIAVLAGSRHAEFDRSKTDNIVVDYDTVLDSCKYIFLAVPDTHLIEVSSSIHWKPDHCCIHCAGSQPADFLASFAAPAQTGAFHPLAAFPRVMPVERQIHAFEQCILAVDGPAEIAQILAEIATVLGGIPINVPASARAGYHLAASMASNLFVALVSLAQDVWSTAGLDPDLALKALHPLLMSTVQNLNQSGLPNALTGPIARGDLGTVQRHLEFLAKERSLDRAAAIYRSLGMEAVQLARRQNHIAPALLDIISNELAGDIQTES